jgi:hypothetical protein
LERVSVARRGWIGFGRTSEKQPAPETEEAAVRRKRKREREESKARGERSERRCGRPFSYSAEIEGKCEHSDARACGR